MIYIIGVITVLLVLMLGFCYVMLSGVASDDDRSQE